MEDIKNVETYDPSKVGTKELKDDWRIVTAWFSQIVQGREFTYSKEQVLNLAHLIVNEMKSRKIKFHPEKMKPNAKKLFELVEKGQITFEEDEVRDLAPFGSSGEELGDRIFLEDVLDNFKDFYVSKPAIYLVGGLCNHPEKGTVGDIDILIRMKKPKGNDMMPVIFRIYRMFPQDMWDRIQILWSDDDFGPFTNFVPLYDQVFERRRDSKQIVLMSEEEEITDLVEEILEGVEVDEKTITPLKFFKMLKGIAGYRKQEKFSIPGVLRAINQKDYPFEVDQKFDGMRLQIHKAGSDVKIFSLNGEDITSKLPFIVSEMKKKPDAVLDAEMTGWTKGFRKGEHLGRSDVAGFVNAKKPMPHTNFFANTFDIVSYKGKPTNELPLSERRKLLEEFGATEHIRVIDMKVAKNDDQMIKAIEWASKLPASEGAMIKSLASKYPLSGQTSKWIKFKVESDIDCEVLMVDPVTGAKAWNYLCILRTSRGDPVPVGRTYNTSIKVNKGDIIRVSFGNMNMYTDPKSGKVWFNWVFPRVIESREDKTKPDTDFTARNLNKETKGEVGQKPWPKRYREVLKADEVNELLLDYENNIIALSDTLDPEVNIELGNIILFDGKADWKDANPYLTPGSEEKEWKFVLQDHFRGKSVHSDLRMERPSFLVGWTLNNQIAGKPSEDIETVAEGKAFSKQASNFKPMTSPNQIVVEKKAPEPLVWLKHEGISAPGEVGATKEKTGVFVIGSKGKVEFGTQKPTFHEYFLQSSGGAREFSGRLVVRLLKNIWKKDPAMKTGRGNFVWMSWFTKDDKPYVLSKRAVDTNIMPPDGLSWLPKYIRDQIPKEYRYWTKKGQAARKLRDELSKLWRTRKIKLKIKGVDEAADAGFPTSGKFTLSHICWRGPVVIRLGCSRQEWHLFLEMGSKAFDIIMDQDPTKNPSVPATFGKPKSSKVLTQEGKIPNRTDLNPDKKTPAFLKILEKGTFKVLEDSPKRKVIEFKGGQFRGTWELLREKTKNLWNLKKTDGK